MKRKLILIFIIFVLVAVSFLYMIKASAINVSQGDGIIVYGKSGQSAPQYRIWDGSNWGTETAVTGATFAGTPRFIDVKASSIRNEVIAAVQNDSGTIFVVKFDATAGTWSQLGSNISSGITDARAFAFHYEQTSGDLIFIYGGAVDPSYYVYNGSTWSGPTAITQATKTTGNIRWIQAAARITASSDEIAIAYADANGDLNALTWSGSAWTEQSTAGALSTGLENNAGATTMRAFDLEYESVSGELFVIWGNSATVDPRYITRTAAGTWGAVTTASTFTEIPSIIDISAEPWGNRIIIGAQDDTTANSNDGDCAVWDGSAIVNPANCDITRDSQEAGDMVLGHGWVKASNGDIRALGFYSDAADLQLDYNYWPVGAFVNTQAFTPSPNCISSNSDDNSFVVKHNPYNNAEIMIIRQAGTAICAQKTNFSGGTTWNFANAGDGASIATPSVSQYQPVGFAYFIYMPPSTYAQSGYRILANADSGEAGAALGAQNSAYTLTTTSQAFRLRMLLHIESSGLIASTGTFKLQFAGKGAGSCASPSGTPGTYTDITTSTAISFKDNAAVADGIALSATLDDPIHGADTVVNQTYEEANNFTNSEGTILTGQDGQWDFALYDNSGLTSTTYCIRAVKSTGTVLETYSVYPEITTAPAGSLSVDIVDGAGAPVASPSYSLSSVSQGFACQTVTGTFGTASQKVRVTNTTGSPIWTLSIAATSGATSLWAVSALRYDFNDGTGSGCTDGADTDSYGGQMTINASAGTSTPEGGCNNTGVTLGSTSSYVEGSTNNVTMLSASGAANTNCYWDLTNVSVSQKIPLEQAAGTYNINMTLTITAS
jgi:hypothetical protein